MSHFHNIVVIGMPGAGKSEVGRLLSLQLGMGFLDLDQRIQSEDNVSAEQHIKKNGIDSWRKREKKALREIQRCRKMVIAVGGGCVSDEESLELLKSLGVLVYLECEIPELVRRLQSKSELKKRPLLADAINKTGNVDISNLETLLRGLKGQRCGWFEKAADVAIPTDYASAQICTQWLCKVLAEKEGYAHLWSS